MSAIQNLLDLPTGDQRLQPGSASHDPDPEPSPFGGRTWSSASGA